MNINSFKALFAISFVLGLASLTFGQQRFKVWSECASGCDRPSHPTSVHFDYSGGFHISVELDYPDGVTITKDNFRTRTEFDLYQKPTKYFVNKQTGKRVDSALNSLLLQVYNLGGYCDNNNLKGGFPETGRFKVLAELRAHLGGESFLPRGPNNISPDEAWNVFWPQFRDAVNKRDRVALKRMMSNPFNSGGGGDYTPSRWISFIDKAKLWQRMQRAVALGTRPLPQNRSGSKRPSRVTNDDQAGSPIFELSKDGRWRWTGVMGD